MNRTIDIYMAAATGDLPWLKQSMNMVEKSAQSDLNENGLNVLHLTCLHGHLASLKYLVEECKVPVDSASKSGWRGLHLSINTEIRKQSKLLVAYLIQKGADINVKNDDGVTPVHQAASEGIEECLELLLDNNVSIDVYDHKGNLPIDLAKLWGHKKCIKLLAHKMWHVRKSKSAKKHLELNKKKAYEDIKLRLNIKDSDSLSCICGNLTFYDWYFNLSHKPKKETQKKDTPGTKKDKSIAHHKKWKSVPFEPEKVDQKWTNALHPQECFHGYITNLKDLTPRDQDTLEVFPYSTPVTINPYYLPNAFDESFENQVANLNIADKNLRKKVAEFQQYKVPMDGKVSSDLRALKRRENRFRELLYRRHDLDDHVPFTLPDVDKYPGLRRLHERETQIETVFPLKSYKIQ